MAAHSPRIIAIADVHGCLNALDALLEAIAPASDDTLVFLGDMIDHGRDSRDTIERIIGLESQCAVVRITGNHEEMMLWARDDQKALAYWENHGGAPTLSSYRFPGRLQDIPEEHWRLVERCVPYYETEGFLFTHANYAPDLPMAEQAGSQLRWTLFDPQEMRPHMSGKPVLVGHTEQSSGEVLDLGFAMCLDTACWRYGWLTAIEPSTGEMWQASKWGVLREQGEESHRERLTMLFGANE
jgi:serine/threonine protein phosphatase 1